MKLKVRQINKNIKIEETKHCFFLKNIFSPRIVAGFTKTSLSGQLPADFNKLIPYIGKKVNFSYMQQKHSSRIALSERPNIYNADGLFTKQLNHFLIVKTADCLPLFFVNKDSLVGVIHMGWRSAEKGILDNIPFNLVDFKVVAGVGLRSCCYQVGKEFRKFTKLSPYIKKGQKNLYFDPIQFVKEKLVAKGLSENNFWDLNLCSFCSNQQFFSYRRDLTKGRNLSFTALID